MKYRLFFTMLLFIFPLIVLGESSEIYFICKYINVNDNQKSVSIVYDGKTPEPLGMLVKDRSEKVVLKGSMVPKMGYSVFCLSLKDEIDVLDNNGVLEVYFKDGECKGNCQKYINAYDDNCTGYGCETDSLDLYQTKDSFIVASSDSNGEIKYTNYGNVVDNEDSGGEELPPVNPPIDQGGNFTPPNNDVTPVVDEAPNCNLFADFRHFFDNSVIKPLRIVAIILFVLLTTVDYVKVIFDKEASPKNANTRLMKRVIALLVIVFSNEIVALVISVLC